VTVTAALAVAIGIASIAAAGGARAQGVPAAASGGPAGPPAAGMAQPPDAMAESLTGARGDPARGRAIVLNRQVGLCLLCHGGPFPEERFQGDLGPDLSGAGRRWTEGQLRLRIVDPGRVNPATIMPAYHRTEGLVRVAPAWRGKPVLSPQQIEDVVAFLTTLTD
jgi:sulfur-oxidizing protein SoxX